MMSAIFVIVFASNLHAATKTVNEHYVKDGEVIMYVTGLGDEVSDVTYQIGKKACDVKKVFVGTVSNPIHTIILWDNSLSVMSKNEEAVRSFLTELVANRVEGEDFAIAVIDSKVTKIVNYTNDYATLKSVIDSTEIQNKDAYLIENLYDVVEELNELDTQEFYRIVVISDGVDATQSGVSTDELYRLLRETPYPIYTISAGGGSLDVTKDMFAISRATGVSYFSLAGEEAVNSNVILTTLREDSHVLKVTAIIPDDMKDGNLQNSRLMIDGNAYDCLIKLPFFIDNGGDKTEEIKEETVANDVRKETLNTTDEGSNPLSKHRIIVGAGIMLALALICTGIIIFLNSVKKKNRRKNSYRSAERMGDLTGFVKNPYSPNGGKKFQETEIYDDNETELFNDAGTEMMFSGKRITLTNKDNPNEVYSSVIKGKTIIGRDINCELAITNDAKVSRTHCEIYEENSDVYINDMCTKNGTKVRGRKISAPVILCTGDTITVGCKQYEVTVD